MQSPWHVHHSSRREALPADMDARGAVGDKTGTLVPLQGRRASEDAASVDATAATPWRRMLERRWDRKVDEVIALAGACQSVSAAGDDLPADGAALPSFRLYCRAAAACDDLGMIADAIARVDNGAYGRCDRCEQPMTDDWLAADPVRQYCPACSVFLPVRMPLAVACQPPASRSTMPATERQAVSASADRSCGPRNQVRNSARSSRSQRSR
jgi:RNA polymerase-binding transcription factor DksA